MTLLCIAYLTIMGRANRNTFLGTFFLAIMVDATYLMLR